MAEARRMLARLTLPVQPLRVAPDARPIARARGPTGGARCALALRRGGEMHAASRARSPVTALAEPGRALRHFGVDVAVFADGAAFRPCRGQPQGAGLGAGPCLHLRHAADQHHPPPAPARRRCGPGRRRGRGAGLVGRHADRGLPACLQPRLGAARAGAGRGGAADHRRAGPRRSGARWRARWSGCTCRPGG